MADPLELEFQETQKYFLQIEGTMHDIIKFYSTIVLAVVTASIALASMQGPTEQAKLKWLSILWLALAATGYLILLYFFELRIRKVKMIDRMAAIREYFANREHGSIEGWLRNDAVFITTVPKSPPYLRRPSGEWYLMLYLSALNSTAAAFVAWGLAFHWIGSLWAIVGGALVIFFGQFWTVTASAHKQDLDRARRFGQSTYSFLPDREVPFLLKPFDWVACAIEGVTRCRNK